MLLKCTFEFIKLEIFWGYFREYRGKKDILILGFEFCVSLKYIICSRRYSETIRLFNFRFTQRLYCTTSSVLTSDVNIILVHIVYIFGDIPRDHNKLHWCIQKSKFITGVGIRARTDISVFKIGNVFLIISSAPNRQKTITQS